MSHLEEPTKDTVLCVDDDSTVLSALRRMLTREQFEVVTATNAANALASLRKHPVKVIISDQRMPDMNGAELLAEVGQRWPRIGRVILTAYPGAAVMAEGIRAGVDFLFNKPWDDDALRTAIRRLIRKARQRDILRLGPDLTEFDIGGEAG